MDLQISARAAYSLTIWLAFGVLLGGRCVEIIFYEWTFYRRNLAYVPAIWLGGMSTHGILLGATVATWLWCWRNRRSFLRVADHLAIAGAYIMGLGRLGNFIDGQIAGSITDAPWGVKFPDLEGFRHPVVLYDGIKNLLLVPLLLLIRSGSPPTGVVLGHFMLWYGCLRIFIDVFREYRTTLFGLPPGQEFNLLMTVVGLTVIAWAHFRPARRSVRERVDIEAEPDGGMAARATWGQRAILVGLLLVPLVIPSDWTQDVPDRYGKRHQGLQYSELYPQLSPAQLEPRLHDAHSGDSRKDLGP